MTLRIGTLRLHHYYLAPSNLKEKVSCKMQISRNLEGKGKGHIRLRLIKRDAVALLLPSLSTQTPHAYQGCQEYPEACAHFLKTYPPKLNIATMIQSLGLRGQTLHIGQAEEAYPGNAGRALCYPILSFLHPYQVSYFCAKKKQSLIFACPIRITYLRSYISQSRVVFA
jgi:hypothetical protein